tara:strand:+ start:3140 stop:3526 length:387 start_codon:yes stop_codon:yes gene_type:complete
MSKKDYTRVQYVTQRLRDGFDSIFQGNFRLNQHYHKKEGTIDFNIQGMPNEISITRMGDRSQYDVLHRVETEKGNHFFVYGDPEGTIEGTLSETYNPLKPKRSKTGRISDPESVKIARSFLKDLRKFL